MTDLSKQQGQPMAEMSLVGACLACGGDLWVRVTPGGAHSVCPKCRWISKPQLVMSPEGVTVHYAAAQA